MTQNEKERIGALQLKGLGYKKIAAELGLPVNTVKTHCRRHPVVSPENICEHCAKPVYQPPHTRKKRFCSDACRMAWWKAHPEKIQRKKLYQHICGYCGRSFSSPRTTSQFCSRSCYGNARRKEGYS